MRAALVQLTASDDPDANLPVTEGFVRAAAARGAEFVLTPEMTNLVAASAARRQAAVRTEAEDPTLARLRAVAAELRLWLLIGSLALRPGDGDGRLANRSVLVGPDGGIRARYDKIHMFDVDLAGGETYRESSGFRPGDRAVLAQTPWGGLGMTVCYDLRFPQLCRALAQAGAAMLAIPAAFTVPTGRAHWEVLLRARAIECGAFVLAPAQCGRHPQADGAERRTWGHSLAVAPWGEVLADGGEAPGVTLVDLDLAAVAEARRRVPSLRHDRNFGPPGG
jgi:predicted amidohydrolase